MKIAHNAKDLTNARFGRLIVLRRVETPIGKVNGQVAYWECKCDCGNKVVKSSRDLLRGSVKSCGCLYNEINHKRKLNTYDLSNKTFGIGFCTNSNEKFYFDIEDYDNIKNYTWAENCNGYVIATNGNTNRIFLHNIVMNNHSNMIVDHISGNTKDNRKNNLRFVNRSQNAMNAKLPSNNTSGVKGVSYSKKFNKWRAYITLNKKQINLGMYSIFEDAVFARKQAEEKYFGKYSYCASRKIS